MAAVAGLAALAVVLVQNVVGDTSEQVSGNNARATAARIAASRINDEALAEGTSKDLSIGTNEADVNDKYAKECRRLAIFYADAAITSNYDPGTRSGANWDPSDEPECTVSASSTGTAAPGAPTGVTYGPATGVLSWTAPTGSVTSYSVTCTGAACPTGSPWTSSSTSVTVGTPPGSAMTGDTALYSVTATNSGGTGPAGTITYTVP